MEVTTYTTQQTYELAKQIAPKFKCGDIVALYGDLGSGKTTFVGYIVKALNSTVRVQSPTFVLARQYLVQPSVSGITIVNHLDLYRITSTTELRDLGLEDLLSMPGAVTFIEWPEIAEDTFKSDVIKIYFEVIDEHTRKIKVSNLN